MKRLFFLVSTAALGLAAYLILKSPGSNLASASPDDLDTAADHVGGWGAKQRVTGAGSSVAGSVEQAAGDLVGNQHLSNQGAFDQAKGAVKDAAGQVANAVEGAVHDLNR